MQTLTKALVGTVAAGAMAVSAASPALARHDDRGDSDAGKVIAGALVIGGIAAIAAAASKNKRDRYGYGRDYRYDRAGYQGGYGHSRDVVQRCVRAAERDASRYSYGRADVTRITSIRDRRHGFDVRGRIALNNRGYRWGHNGYDTGRFTCKVRHGRIADIAYSGLRGLR